MNIWKFDSEGKMTEVSIPPEITISPKEKLVSEACGGGGCGDPLERDPDKVRWKAREGWISTQKARDIYGVVIDTGVEEYAVDWEATKELREQHKKERGA